MSQPIDTEPDTIRDESPELDAATFDLDAWIGGVTGTVRATTIYQRADLMAEVDRLQRELRIAESIDDEDRGMTDESPESIRRQLEQVARDFEASGLTVRVQGQSDGHRERITKVCKKRGIDDEYEITLHHLADAIVEPKGINVDFLRKLGERNEMQLKMLLTAASLASFQPPRVDVPFSSQPSGNRRQRRSG